jgi:hypothetical protein
MRPTRHRLAWGVLVLSLLWTGGCRSAYYGAMETLGREKRHILVDRVADGREEQRAAQEQFQTTLDAFKAVTGFEGGDLEDVYRRLDREYQGSEERAAAVRSRIGSIEQVAGDLFDEWEDESDEISSASLRRGSEQRLRETRRSYEQLIAAMRRAESRMDPVLQAFRDRVLYLKHNLNARAIASLEGDLAGIEADVERLVADMNASIAEAEAFLAKLES